MRLLQATDFVPHCKLTGPPLTPRSSQQTAVQGKISTKITVQRKHKASLSLQARTHRTEVRLTRQPASMVSATSQNVGYSDFKMLYNQDLRVLSNNALGRILFQDGNRNYNPSMLGGWMDNLALVVCLGTSAAGVTKSTQDTFWTGNR